MLTPDTVFQLTPSSLAAMMDSQSADEGAVGKLITSDRWYFAASLPNEAAERLREGERPSSGLPGTSPRTWTCGWSRWVPQRER